MLNKALKSRTFWTVIVMFIIGGVQAVEVFMPVNLFVAVQGMLSVLTMYFKLNPSQEY